MMNKEIRKCGKENMSSRPKSSASWRMT